MKLVRRLALLIAVLVFTGGLRAQFVLTIITSTADFSGRQVVEGFDTLANSTAVTTQFVTEGLTFSTGFIASTNSGDTTLYPNNAGGVILTNFYGNSTPALNITLTFFGPETAVAFYTEMNAGDTLTLTTSLGGVSHGSVSYNSVSTRPVFFGVKDLAKFDTLTFTVSGNNNHFLGIDSLTFEAVPEPASWALLGLGLLPVLWVFSRRAVSFAAAQADRPV